MTFVSFRDLLKGSATYHELGEKHGRTPTKFDVHRYKHQAAFSHVSLTSVLLEVAFIPSPKASVGYELVREATVSDTSNSAAYIEMYTDEPIRVLLHRKEYSEQMIRTASFFQAGH